MCVCEYVCVCVSVCSALGALNCTMLGCLQSSCSALSSDPLQISSFARLFCPQSPYRVRVQSVYVCLYQNVCKMLSIIVDIFALSSLITVYAQMKAVINCLVCQGHPLLILSITLLSCSTFTSSVSLIFNRL